MFGAAFVTLPVHSGRFSIKNLHTIHAHIAAVRLGITGDDLHEGDITAAIVRPTFQRRNHI
jgi:hypothetical protein